MRKILHQKRGDFNVLFALALSYKNDKQLEDALNTYKIALDINPDFADIYFNMANIYEIKNDTKKELD